MTELTVKGEGTQPASKDCRLLVCKEFGCEASRRDVRDLQNKLKVYNETDMVRLVSYLHNLGYATAIREDNLLYHKLYNFVTPLKIDIKNNYYI